MSTPPPALACVSCEVPIAPAEFLSACSGLWWELGLVHFRCPSCGSSTEVQLTNERITLGYTYAAGAPHFCGMIEIGVPGLEVQLGRHHLEAQLGERTWTIPAPTPRSGG